MPAVTAKKVKKPARKKLNLSPVEWDSEDRLCERCYSLIGHESGDMNCARGRWFSKKGRVADVMIIGDAPGEADRAANSYFAGASGMRLANWLDESGLSSKRVYLDNAVRCSLLKSLPNQSTTNRKKLVNNCRVYLERELARLKPKVVILLGNGALNSVIRETGIDAWRGKVIKHPGLRGWVVPSIHPKMLFQGRFAEEEIVVSDFQLARKLLDAPPEFKDPRVVFVRTQKQFDACMKEIEASKEFVVDLETVGLDAMNPDNQIIGMGLCAKANKGWFIPYLGVDDENDTWKDEEEIPKIWKARIRKLLNSSRVKIAHNMGYDALWFRSKLNAQAVPIYDTIIAKSMLEPEFPNGLKPLVWRYNDFGGYESELSKFLKTSKTLYNAIAPSVLSRYGAYDVIAGYTVYKLQQKELRKHVLSSVLAEQNEMRVNLTEMEFAGLRLDLPLCRKLKVEYTGRLATLEKALKRGFKKPDLNLDSSAQMIDALWGDDGLFDIRHYKQLRKPSADKHALRVLRKATAIKAPKKAELIDKLSEYRVLSKRLSTFIEVFLNRSYDGIIHPHFSQYVARTGRLNSYGPNLQNIPRLPDIRNCIIAGKGKVLLELDYSQLELRIGAEYSRDANMLKILNSGGDIHAFVGDNSILRADGTRYGELIFLENKEMRAKAKITGFSVIYGKTAASLAEDLGCSVQEAARIIELLVRVTFPDLGVWINEQHKLVAQNGYITTIFGRQIPVEGAFSGVSAHFAGALRKAVNYPIQSAASDCVITGINRVLRRMRKEKWPCTPRLTVHDSLLLEVERGAVKEIAAKAKEEMEFPNGVVQHVKLTVDAGYGKRWGELKKC